MDDRLTSFDDRFQALAVNNVHGKLICLKRKYMHLSAALWNEIHAEYIICKYELKCLEMYINIRMAWCGNLGGVYEGAAGSQVSVICGMNLQLCVTVGTYNVGEVVLIKCYFTALVSDYV